MVPPKTITPFADTKGHLAGDTLKGGIPPFAIFEADPASLLLLPATGSNLYWPVVARI